MGAVPYAPIARYVRFDDFARMDAFVRAPLYACACLFSSDVRHELTQRLHVVVLHGTLAVI
jgi:hypothetical protein